MESKFKSTKKLEEEMGKPAHTRSKPVQKEQLIKKSRENFYANLKGVYQENKDAKELPPPPKKKPANDIIKKNMEAAKLKAAARNPIKPGTGGPKVASAARQGSRTRPTAGFKGSKQPVIGDALNI